MPADPVPLRLVWSQDALPAEIARDYVALLTRYAADLDAINRDAKGCQSPEALYSIQERTLLTTTAALDAVSKLCSHVIETYARLLTLPQ